MQGMRTVVVTNYTETAAHPYPRAPGEVWTSYPDANPVRSFYPGDDRAALTPFLAFRELGDSFKWLVYPAYRYPLQTNLTFCCSPQHLQFSPNLWHTIEIPEVPLVWMHRC